MLTLSRAMVRSTLHADVTADAVAQCTAIRALLEQACIARRASLTYLLCRSHYYSPSSAHQYWQRSATSQAYGAATVLCHRDQQTSQLNTELPTQHDSTCRQVMCMLQSSTQASCSAQLSNLPSAATFHYLKSSFGRNDGAARCGHT
eukprot:7816-Heterococcus_DN1.PRE.4